MTCLPFLPSLPFFFHKLLSKILISSPDQDKYWSTSLLIYLRTFSLLIERLTYNNVALGSYIA